MNGWIVAHGAAAIALGASTSVALAQDAVDAAHVDIPSTYRGKWALDPKFCDHIGPAVVNIGPRTIDFYERHGVLDLAQLNYADTAPSLYGSFRFVELLHFSTGVVRLELKRGRLVITEADDPDAPSNPATWTRCSTARP